MQVLSVGESTLQGKLNSLCSHKTPGRVDNDSVGDMVSPVYILSIGSFEVGPNRREELQDGHFAVMSIHVRICRQEPLVERIWMRRIARGRTVGLELLSFVDIDISSIRNLSTPVLSSVVSTFHGRHEIPRSSKALSQSCPMFQAEKVDIPFVGGW